MDADKSEAAVSDAGVEEDGASERSDLSKVRRKADRPTASLLAETWKDTTFNSVQVIL